LVWQALVNAVMNLCVSYRETSWQLSTC
jgi:hypothetical protein